MSQYYYHQPGSHSSMATRSSLATGGHHHHHNNNNNHRSRRSTRFNSAQFTQKQFKDISRTQIQKEPVEVALATALRKEFEAARSFDLEDDEMFCPWHLLTEDDLYSIHSASSDRSSSSGSESPEHSPLQHQPTPTFGLGSNSTVNQFQTGQQFKIHAPQAQRTRNAIPIVDPNSRHTSPPNSMSPARQAQKSFYPRRW